MESKTINKRKKVSRKEKMRITFYYNNKQKNLKD